jgi:type II secretory pathway pseudopilin PulG
MAREQSGLTIVEILVSVLLVAIAVAFTFGMQVRTSNGFRDQSSVAEVQQTLRSATDLIVKDLRQAGLLATGVYNGAYNGGLTSMSPVLVTDNAAGDGTDVITLTYADESTVVHIQTGGPNFNSAETLVDTWGDFHDGDVLMAVRTRPCNQPSGTPIPVGGGCVLQITGLTPGGPKIQHHPGGTYNLTGNSQCTNPGTDMSYAGGANGNSCWNDGYTVFVRAVNRSYRIKPGDPRGVLQMSPSGGAIANDWVDLALGIVDLQVAVRIYEPAGTIDRDGDGDARRNWYSGSTLAATLATAGNVPLEVSVTLVAKTTKEVSGPTVTKTADIFEAGKPLDNNRVGNHAGTNLPVASSSSPYYGSFVYRSYTATVDLRNVGIGL